MSRRIYDAEDGYRATEDIAASLDRIADILDDYLTLTLSAQEATATAARLNPDSAPMLQPILDAIAAVKERRAER